MKNIKAALREAVFAEIAALPEDYITQSDEGIYKNVLALEEFKSAERIFIYCSVNREPDTRRIIAHALEMGKTVALPLCFKAGVMEAREIHSLAELVPGVLGIPAPAADTPVVAPETLDLIIVPAVAFDKNRYRLGYGAGYYDRYLGGLDVKTVGIARARCVRDAVPRDEHDVAVDRVVTEEG